LAAILQNKATDGAELARTRRGSVLLDAARRPNYRLPRHTLFRRMISLLGQNELPVPATRENARNSPELLRKLKSGNAETAGFLGFPCYFPC
jgi:hypothetical protein